MLLLLTATQVDEGWDNTTACFLDMVYYFMSGYFYCKESLYGFTHVNTKQKFSTFFLPKKLIPWKLAYRCYFE